jgi:hypothetical protein
MSLMLPVATRSSSPALDFYSVNAIYDSNYSLFCNLKAFYINMCAHCLGTTAGAPKIKVSFVLGRVSQ